GRRTGRTHGRGRKRPRRRHGHRPPRAMDPDAGVPGFVPRLPVGFDENGDLRYHPVVDRLAPGSNPWNAGLRNGDTILAVNGIDARRRQAWMEMMGRRIGTPYTLRIRRGEEREIRAEVVPRRLHPRGSSTGRVPTP
ncbi:MAG TPA: hypothetical protein VHG28_23840, partial [Longimicrobiaceae bacterium]|nr:hypothetical protein [Longimicrobiaceae bacterium]